MRCVVQRVKWAQVRVGGSTVARIGAGLLVLVGMSGSDSTADAAYLAEKMAGLRIFPDQAGKMNLSVLETGGAILAVPNFTLYGDCSRGRRPSFTRAAPPELAGPLFSSFVERLKGAGLRVEVGSFREHMEVELTNDGPVTLLLDSEGRPQ